MQGFQHSENAFFYQVKTLFQASKIDARHLLVDLEEQHEGVLFVQSCACNLLDVAFISTFIYRNRNIYGTLIDEYKYKHVMHLYTYVCTYVYTRLYHIIHHLLETPPCYLGGWIPCAAGKVQSFRLVRVTFMEVASAPASFQAILTHQCHDIHCEIDHPMCPTCQLPIYQLRFFLSRASSPATPLSSPRGLWLQTHLLSPPLLPSIQRLSWNKAWVHRQMKRLNSESGRSCFHLVCLKIWKVHRVPKKFFFWG